MRDTRVLLFRFTYYFGQARDMEYRETAPASRREPRTAAKREELELRIAEAGRENSTATVLFHNAIADRVGLNATESKMLDLLVRHGPSTAGEIARYTGLATASVTGLVDGLERKGFVSRRRDTGDRRRVIVEPVMERIEAMAPCFAMFRELTGELLETYDDEEMELILSVMERVTRFMREATARMTNQPVGDLELSGPVRAVDRVDRHG